ncbi:hypothetical protein [Acinetobacter sp. SM34]
MEQEKIESLALPRLATGVGSLDWEMYAHSSIFNKNDKKS